MGGQTALNLTLELDDSGILERYGVEVIGTSPSSIRQAEDRQAFKELVQDRWDWHHLRSSHCSSLSMAREVAKKNGFSPDYPPPALPLGGQGGAVAYGEEEFDSPDDQGPAGEPHGGRPSWRNP